MVLDEKRVVMFKANGVLKGNLEQMLSALSMGLSMGLFFQNELKRGIYGKSAKIKNRFSNNLCKLRRLENSEAQTLNQ